MWWWCASKRLIGMEIAQMPRLGEQASLQSAMGRILFGVPRSKRRKAEARLVMQQAGAFRPARRYGGKQLACSVLQCACIRYVLAKPRKVSVTHFLGSCRPPTHPHTPQLCWLHAHRIALATPPEDVGCSFFGTARPRSATGWWRQFGLA